MQTLTLVRFAPWMSFQNAHPHDVMWPCALLYAAAMARREGWKTHIVDLHVEDLTVDGIVDRIAGQAPDVVLFDTMTPSAAVAIDTSRRLKDRLPDVLLLGVGQHASEAPKDLLLGEGAYDGILLGEHEHALLEILRGAELREVDGTAWRDGDTLGQHGEKQELKDLGTLPPISPEGLLLDRYRMRSVAVPQFGKVRWGFMLTSRGCPYPCTFCSPTLRQSYGRGFRAQAPEEVVADMERLHRDWGVTAYYMIDDVFSLHKGRVKAICEGLIALDLPIHWTIQTRADLLNPEMCQLLKQAGCVAVKMGIESGVPRILDLIKKKETREQMLSAASAVHGSGMRLTAYYMLGHPTETRQEMEATFAYAKEIDADMIQVAFHTPYPGSDTWAQYAGEVTDLSELNHYETQHLNASEVDSETLEALQRQFYLRYYLAPKTLSRYLRRRLLYRFSDPGEWKLAASTLRYLLLDRGRKAATPSRVSTLAR